MSDMTADQVQAMINDGLDKTRAEIREDAKKWGEELLAKFGTVENAQAQGVVTDFQDREKIGSEGGVESKEEKEARERRMARNFPNDLAFGRFVRGLAGLALEQGIKGQRAVEHLAKEAKSAGDIQMAKAIERSFEADRQKVMAISDFPAGGALVPEEYMSEVIPLLYAEMVVMESGATRVPMPNGNLTMPYGDTGVTGGYVGEIENAPVEEPTVGQIKMTAKKAALIVAASNDILRRTPSSGADRFIQDAIVNGLGRLADVTLLRGVGTDASPKGARQFVIDSGDTDLVFNSAGTTLANKVADLSKAVRVVQENNIPFLNAGWVFDKRTEWGLKSTLTTDGQFVFMAEMAAGMLMGFPFKSTTAMPTNIGTGSNKGEVLFYNFGHFLVGETDSLELTISPDGAYHNGSSVVSGLSQDTTPIRAILRHDTASRFRGLEGSLIQDVAWA